MNLSADHWQRVFRLLDDALDLEPAERGAWLVRVDSDHPVEAPHVRRLFAAHDRPVADDVLNRPAAELVAAALASQATVGVLVAGHMLGSYRLIEPIGQGGMAVVWLAEQTLNVSRRVALKVPQTVLEDSTSMTERFEHERDFLAGLEHPHIARLYDAGVTEAGQPYLVMEWIDGQPITAYADARRLPIGKRIDLFRQVLQAVRYAHARLVIHRDLKPSNILVTADGDVKLLDFGIARLLGGGLEGGRPGPESTRSAMTPETASPEQLAGEVLTTSSDVYSLGVLLYELLVGLRPYRLDVGEDTNDTRALHTALLAATVVRPSDAVATANVASLRGTTSTRLRGALVGDLDAIVCKALMKPQPLRYESVDQLDADLRRWQEGRPVLARRGTLFYRASRFASRNRVGVIAASAGLVALCVGLAVSLWEAERAREEARLAQSVQGFLTKLFAANDPEEARGRDVGAKELLARGASRLDVELKDHPEVLARLQQEIGTIYFQLGDNVTAIEHLQVASKLYLDTGEQASEEAVETKCRWAEALGDEDQIERARQATMECLDLASRSFGKRNRWRLPAQTELAWLDIETGHPQSAADLMERSLLEVAQLKPYPAVQTHKSRTNLATAYLDLGRVGEARDIFADLVRVGPLTPGVELTDQMVDRLNLARARYLLQEYEPVAAEMAALVPLMDQQIGPTHDRTIKARSLWSQTLVELGDFDHAVEIQETNLDAVSKRPSIDADVLNLQKLTLAKLLKSAARPGEALPLAVEGLAFEDAKYPEPSWVREAARRLVGDLLLQNRQTNEAIAMLHQASMNGARIDGYAGNVKYADLLQAEGLALWRRGQPDDARQALALLDQAMVIYIAKLSASGRATLRCAVHRAWIEAMTRPRDAGAVAPFLRASELYGDALPKEHIGHAELLLIKAELDRRAGDAAAARRDGQSGREQWLAVMHTEFVPPVLGLH